jgi:hypothetical protein
VAYYFKFTKAFKGAAELSGEFSMASFAIFPCYFVSSTTRMTSATLEGNSHGQALTLIMVSKPHRASSREQVHCPADILTLHGSTV